MNPLFLLWGAGNGEASASPAVSAELADISQAFSIDYRKIHLLPHERRQLMRIAYLAKRDEKAAVTALRIFKRRATMMRKSLRKVA